MAVQVEIAQGVARVTINRPRQSNAIDVETHEALRALWTRLSCDGDVKVIILTGAGKRAFCAGADVRSFLPYLTQQIAAGSDPGDFGGLTRHHPGKTVIAAINGAAMGGGLELALAADIRIAVETAMFGLPEVRLGAIAGAGGITRLMRTIPEAVAKDMLLTGRPITARRAYEIGLISEVVSTDALIPAAEAIARCLIDNSQTALRATRAVIDDIDGLPLDAALTIERAAFQAVALSEDYATGVQSFLNRRSPHFSGN